MMLAIIQFFAALAHNGVWSLGTPAAAVPRSARYNPIAPAAQQNLVGKSASLLRPPRCCGPYEADDLPAAQFAPVRAPGSAHVPDAR